jgi:hypothetical protein
VPNVTVVGPFPLNKQQSVIEASSFTTTIGSQYFLKEGTGTFQTYIYLDSLTQTGGVSDCGTRSNQPSCSSGLYDPCKCASLIDCTNCTHSGYKNLISLYGVYNLEVLPFPDASRQNTVSAQLAINTQTADEAFIETIPLPPLPLQKWVFLTILYPLMVQISPKRIKKDCSLKVAVITVVPTPRKGFLVYLNANKPGYFLNFAIWKHWI